MITGALRLAAGRVRVTAQMIDPETGAQVWARVFERRCATSCPSKTRSWRRSPSRSSCRSLPRRSRGSRPPAPSTPKPMRPTPRGGSISISRRPRNIKRAWTYMQQAIDKDPTNPLPYAALALGYCLIGHGTIPPPDAFAKAKAAALKAEELGGTLAETRPPWADQALRRMGLGRQQKRTFATRSPSTRACPKPNACIPGICCSSGALRGHRRDETGGRGGSAQCLLELGPRLAILARRASSGRDGLRPEGARARPQFQSGPLLAGISCFRKRECSPKPSRRTRSSRRSVLPGDGRSFAPTSLPAARMRR